MDIQVLRIGRGWIAINKPAGISVHNDPGKDLCAWAGNHCLHNMEVFNVVMPNPTFGFHPVHRLDRETSGVVLLACDPEVLRFLSGQFESRKVDKRYTALLHGKVEFPDGDTEWQRWIWPLTKTAAGRGNPAGSGMRFPSETQYRLLNHFSRYTLVELRLPTGRKHQIRRHAALAGHAVVGDGRYGTSRAMNYVRHRFGFDRLALHAGAVTLVPPGAEFPETISAPGLPPEIVVLFRHQLESDMLHAGTEAKLLT